MKPFFHTHPFRPQRTDYGAQSFLLATIFCALSLLSVTAIAQDKGGLPIPNTNPPPQMQKGDGWLGVALSTIPLEEAKKRGYSQELVLVDNVFKGSPAAASEFQIGDVILEFEKNKITEVQQIVTLVRGTAPGSKVEFKILRGKKTLKKPLLLALRPDRLGMIRTQFIDRPAPDFSVKTTEASPKMVKLSTHKGNVVVVDFWATWCGPCRKSIPHMNELANRLKDKGLVVVGISDEDRKTINTFAKKTPMHYTIAHDPERNVNREYMVNALPTLFIIDHKGIVREIIIGGGQFDKVSKAVEVLLLKRNATTTFDKEKKTPKP